MKCKSKWESVVQVGHFCIDGGQIVAVITDEKGYIVASVTLAVVYDDEELHELYWALRRALEGTTQAEVIDND